MDYNSTSYKSYDIHNCRHCVENKNTNYPRPHCNSRDSISVVIQIANQIAAFPEFPPCC